MIRLRIAMPPHHAADHDAVVQPGALAQLAELLREAAPAHRYTVIADDRVARLYGEQVLATLRTAGLAAEVLPFPAGEAHKTRESWGALSDELVRLEVGRDACVVALGGGVTGDLAGFVAATYMRGLPLVQVPTTLLAMIDAAIGGKTGVDTALGKNLLGAFHPPRLVVVDPDLLHTLPDEELRTGLAEAVKHGAIADADYFRWLGENTAAVFTREARTFTALIRRSIEIKAGFVAADPYEAGPRQALNFGHTIGHALEALTGYQLAHGHAVAIGMSAEAALGEAAGVTRKGAARNLRAVLAGMQLPVALPPGVTPAALVPLTRRDKKAREAKVHYTLLSELGAVARPSDGGWTFPLEPDFVIATLAALSA